jgi:hypothetical protein
VEIGGGATGEGAATAPGGGLTSVVAPRLGLEICGDSSPAFVEEVGGRVWHHLSHGWWTVLGGGAVEGAEKEEESDEGRI